MLGFLTLNESLKVVEGNIFGEALMKQKYSFVREGGDIAAKKGARVLWALDGRFLIVSGFSRQSERQIIIYETRDLRHLEISTYLRTDLPVSF